MVLTATLSTRSQNVQNDIQSVRDLARLSRLAIHHGCFQTRHGLVAIKGAQKPWMVSCGNKWVYRCPPDGGGGGDKWAADIWATQIRHLPAESAEKKFE